MALQVTPYPVQDFSGGITDYPLDAKPNQSSVIENLVINQNRKLESVQGSQIYNTLYPQIPAGNVRIGGLAKTIDPMFYVMSGRKVWKPGASAFDELLGPTSNLAFSVGTAATNSFASSEWNNHLYLTNSEYASPIKIYKDNTSTYQLRTAGLPPLASTPTVTSTGGTGNNYIYAFHYFYEYNVQDTLFQDFGAVTFVPISNIGAPNTNTVNITAIPAIANGSTLNYDTAVLKCYIYRTVTNGTIFYKIGEVTNGTTTFADTASDSSITTNLVLYTDGGVLDYDPPPQAKYVHIVNGVAYYANIKDGSEFFRNRIRQSIQDDPDSCPQDLYVDVLEEVVGLSSFNDNPLVFSKKRVYRLNGQFNELGQGQVTYEDITKTIGCASHNSIVQTRFGVFWAGDDGFYWTDGFRFKKISESINERYKDLVNSDTKKGRIYGSFDPKDNRVHWAVTADDTSTDNDALFSLDLKFANFDSPDLTFTTRVNGDNFSPTAIEFYQGNMIRADRRGYLFQHLENLTTDPRIDLTTAATNWATSAIIPRYVSTVFNFGLPQVRKWVSKMLLTLQNSTNVSVQINSINDDSSGAVPLFPIRYRGNVLWGDPAPLWGAELPYWNYTNLIEEMRRFPAGTLRCSFKQIEITQAFTNIYNSDSYGAGVVDSASKQVTIVEDWPLDVVDYFITFETDGYVKEYQITARNSATVLTYLDPSGAQPSGASVKWLIKGYPKGEVFNILSYILYYAPLTNQTYRTYRSEQSDTGGNA